MKRFIAAAVGVLSMLTLMLIPASSASAAYVTTDYRWTPYYRCQFSTPWTYEDVRFRFDYRHNSAGKRDAKAITYADFKGSTKVHIQTVAELWSNKTTLSSTGRYPNVSTSSWYVGDKMTWAAYSGTFYASQALSLDDGDTCVVQISLS